MNPEPATMPLQPKKPRKNKALIMIALVLSALIVIAISVWLLLGYLFPKQYTPVNLSPKEQQILDTKIDQLNKRYPQQQPLKPTEKSLEPEKYSEDNASREISFSEREINSLLAHNTDLAQKLVIDLSDNLASAKMLIPVDPDFPVLGGKTLKLSAGLELGYKDARPIVVLRGLSLWGVPMPNAWLGGIKNIDLVKEFGGDHGFWKAFADGVEYINVKEGQLQIKLKE